MSNAEGVSHRCSYGINETSTPAFVEDGELEECPKCRDTCLCAHCRAKRQRRSFGRVETTSNMRTRKRRRPVQSAQAELKIDDVESEDERSQTRWSFRSSQAILLDDLRHGSASPPPTPSSSCSEASEDSWPSAVLPCREPDFSWSESLESPPENIVTPALSLSSTLASSSELDVCPSSKQMIAPPVELPSFDAHPIGPDIEGYTDAQLGAAFRRALLSGAPDLSICAISPDVLTPSVSAWRPGAAADAHLTGMAILPAKTSELLGESEAEIKKDEDAGDGGVMWETAPAATIPAALVQDTLSTVSLDATALEMGSDGLGDSAWMDVLTAW